MLSIATGSSCAVRSLFDVVAGTISRRGFGIGVVTHGECKLPTEVSLCIVHVLTFSPRRAMVVASMQLC
jgi:hypothetical protein